LIRLVVRRVRLSAGSLGLERLVYSTLDGPGVQQSSMTPSWRRGRRLTSRGCSRCANTPGCWCCAVVSRNGGGETELC